jgi:hypothetical protein
LVNSRLGLFTAPTSRSGPKPVTLSWGPFSRSYGTNLPSSLTRTHPSTLVLSHPPTCVGLRYGHSRLPWQGFSGRRAAIASALVARRLPPHRKVQGRCNSNATGDLANPVTCQDLIVREWSRNINRVSIAYAFPPRLRPD